MCALARLANKACSAISRAPVHVARRCRCLSTKPESMLASPPALSVVGAPFAEGQPLDGVDLGPQALRDTGLRQTITGLGWRYEDQGDIEPAAGPPPGTPDTGLSARNAYSVLETNRRLAEAVRAEAERGRFVLTLGGDHSVALGSIAGLLQAGRDTSVLWVDAHADINTPDGSPSGNMHGMPVALLMKLVDGASMPGGSWLADVPALDPSRIVYVGLRDVDVFERKMIAKHGIKSFSMREVDKYGIGRVMEEALDHVNKGGLRPLHMSYDIDAVDPSIAPETGTKVHGGLSFREAHYVAEEAALSGLLSSMDMVEVNPSLGAAGRRGVSPKAVRSGGAQTAAAASHIIASALGKAIM